MSNDNRTTTYDFKMKLNKIDSQQYRNLIIPQVDWILNEGSRNFLSRWISNPRLATQVWV